MLIKCLLICIFILGTNLLTLNFVNANADESIVINLTTRKLILYKDGKVFKNYSVGVGRSMFPTPIGDFKIIKKVKNPAWEHPYKSRGQIRIKSGKASPLGTRWMAFKKDGAGYYGIHGTDNARSVGKYSSHGCVRMYIKDAEELYELITIDTPVIVTK